MRQQALVFRMIYEVLDEVFWYVALFGKLMEEGEMLVMVDHLERLSEFFRCHVDISDSSICSPQCISSEGEPMTTIERRLIPRLLDAFAMSCCLSFISG